MKPLSLLCAAWAALAMLTSAEVTVDNDVLGKSLGGWKKKDGSAAQYPLSGSDYCTYKPEVSPTPEGGIFISVRIDHVRGWMSNNDHATLEITVSGTGVITSAKSSIAIQGVSIASDVILGTNEAGKEITGADRAVQIGTDLVSNLTAKLLRENIVEAGRVTFPAAIRHNYNRLYQALRVDGEPVPFFVTSLPLPDTLDGAIKARARGGAGGRSHWRTQTLLEALLDVARAVAFAHRNGTVHRDLRPIHVHLGPFGEVLLASWFRARHWSTPTSVDRDMRLNEVGSGIGYLAPERLLHGLGHADARADVWGLGALLYAVLADRPWT